jgi:hypothetical protein
MNQADMSISTGSERMPVYRQIKKTGKILWTFPEHAIIIKEGLPAAPLDK